MPNGLKQLPPEEEKREPSNYQVAYGRAEADVKKIYVKLDNIQSREKEIFDGLKASTPQASIKTMVKEYFDLQKKKEEYFQEIGKAWGPVINSAVPDVVQLLKTNVKIEMESAKQKYSGKNIFNIVHDVGAQQDPEIQKVVSDTKDSISIMTNLINDAQNLRDKYGGTFISKDKFGKAKEEMGKIKTDFEAALSTYEIYMKRREELYKEKYGLPHLYGEEYINRNVSTLSKEFGLRSFIKETA
jgi:hypothetical protein